MDNDHYPTKFVGDDSTGTLAHLRLIWPVSEIPEASGRS
jgi:hypothetical protein